MGNAGSVDQVPLAVNDQQRARKAYLGDGKFATSRPVGGSKVVGGVSEVADEKGFGTELQGDDGGSKESCVEAPGVGTNIGGNDKFGVGAVGGPSKLSEVCSGIRERIAASKSRVQEGRTWLGEVMSSKVKHDRAAKQSQTNEGGSG